MVGGGGYLVPTVLPAHADQADQPGSSVRERFDIVDSLSVLFTTLRRYGPDGAGERHPPQIRSGWSWLFVRRCRRAAGTGRAGLTLRTEPGSVSRVAPKTVERLLRVRVRTLRTQQRTESQCQLITFLLPTSRGQEAFGALRDHY